MSTAKEMVELALKFTEPPFGVYHNDIEIGDKNGHVCTAENSDIAKDIVAALNLAALRTLPSSDQCVAREALAAMMMRNSIATGHGDTFESLLSELEWQIQRIQNRALPPSALADPQAAVADTIPSDAERQRCIAICEGWIGAYQDREIKFTSPREYALDAINDIIDLIRDGHVPALTNPAPTELEGK